MGQIFKEALGIFGSFFDSIKMFYLHSIAGYDEDKLCVAIAVFEGKISHFNIFALVIILKFIQVIKLRLKSAKKGLK